MAQKVVQPVNVLSAAGVMGAATFFSRIAGLLREQVFAYFFGAGNAMDAYTIAFRIPNLLRDLFAEGAMSAALVPTFTQVRAQEGDRRAWRVAGLVFRALFFIAIGISLIGIWLAPQLVQSFAAAYHLVPGKFELTVLLTRTMYPFFPMVALAAAFMGILNACGRFFMPAFASALFNLTSIGAGILLAIALPHYWGLPAIQGMAIGVVLGGMVQALCQWPQLKRAGYFWTPREPHEPTWNRDPALRRMLALMIPGLVGLATTQVNVLVNSMLATSQGPGAASWLNYAFRLMQFPIGIFGVSLAAATLPRVSQLWIARDGAGIVQTLDRSLRQVFALNLPASAGLAFLGPGIIELLFEHGHFKASDTHATAMALGAYAIGLSAYSVVKVLVPACYAIGNTRLPVISSVVSVALTIALNLILIRPLGFVGLALGTSFAAFFNAIFLLVALRRLLREINVDFKLGPLLRSFVSHSGVALVMGVGCWIVARGLSHFIPDQLFMAFGGRYLGRSIRLFLVIGLGLSMVWVLGRMLHLVEVTETFELFTKKLKKKLRRDRT